MRADFVGIAERPDEIDELRSLRAGVHAPAPRDSTSRARRPGEMVGREVEVDPFLLLALSSPRRRVRPRRPPGRRARGRAPGAVSAAAGRACAAFVLDRRAAELAHNRRRSAPTASSSWLFGPVPYHLPNVQPPPMSMHGGVQPACRADSADQSIISRAMTAKSRGSLDMRLRWKCVSFRRTLCIFCARLTISTVCSRDMPHLVESLCCFSVPGPCMATPMAVAQRIEVELQADADVDVLAQARGDLLDAIELVHRINVDAQPVVRSPSRALRPACSSR